MADDAHDVGLTARLIDGIAKGFTVNGQALVDRTVLRIPALKGVIEFRGVHTDQHIAQDAFTGHPIFAIAVAAAEPGACPGA